MYSENSHCEWLIQPQVQNSSQKQYISLQFSRMATECSYDYLYVYDGNNYKSRLLGSFSGRVRFEDLGSDCEQSDLSSDIASPDDGQLGLHAGAALL